MAAEQEQGGRGSGAKNKGYLSSLWAAGARGPPTSHPRQYVAGCCGFSRTRSYQYQNLRTHNYMLRSCYQDIITLSPHSCDSLMSWSSSHHRQTHGLQAWAAHQWYSKYLLNHDQPTINIKNSGCFRKLNIPAWVVFSGRWVDTTKLILDLTQGFEEI